MASENDTGVASHCCYCLSVVLAGATNISVPEKTDDSLGLNFVAEEWVVARVRGLAAGWLFADRISTATISAALRSEGFTFHEVR
jgi:hypothetical protein